MCRSPTSKLLYRSLTKAFPLESSPKASWNFKNCNIEYEEHSKQNHSNHFPRSQSSLELNSKASRNFKKPQINEVLQVKASKASKNFHHKPSKTKNMKNTKNKEFLTSSQPEICCNFVSKIFNPFLKQIEGYLVFKSKSHYYNSNQQVFPVDQIIGLLFCNFKESYHTHQYKFTFVKLFYLFDLFQM